MKQTNVNLLSGQALSVIPTVRDTQKSSQPPHVPNPFYSLEELLHDIATTPTSLSTGYTALDAVWRIPTQALTIVAGRPSHGKTAVLINLFLNLIQQNAQNTFLFCSYEVSKKHLLLNILNNICKVTLDEYFNTDYLSAYLIDKLPASGDYSHKIEHGKQSLNRLVKDQRLAIIDERLSIDELIEFLTYFKEHYPVGAVFIDYMQKIKIKGKYHSRQIELQKISEQLLEAAIKLSLPIVLGAQFNREVATKKDMDESKLREAGDIEQDAHSILGVWNESKAQSTPQSPTVPTVIDLIVLKNRNGKTGAELPFHFNGATFTLSEFIDRQTVPVQEERHFY